MSEHISRCYRCLAPNPAWGMTICAACRQVEALEKQTEAANSRAEREAEMYAEQSAANARRLEDQNRESMRIAENNARLARRQAKENARLAAESGVSYDDAYQYGLHYIDGSETYNLDIELSEEGKIKVARTFSWNNFLSEFYHFEPYKMAHLNQAFDRGLQDSVKDVLDPGLDYMIDAAYKAGLNLEEEFRIPTDVLIGKNEVVSAKFTTKIRRSVDTVTGHVTYMWDHPFKSTALNESFSAGVNAVAAEENSDEEVSNRLATEVPMLLAEQERAQKQQEIFATLQAEHNERERIRQYEELAQEVKDGRQALVVYLLMVACTVFMVLLLWFVDHGFIAFVTLVGGAWVAIYQWWNDITTDNLRKTYERGVFAKSMIE